MRPSERKVSRTSFPAIVSDREKSRVPQTSAAATSGTMSPYDLGMRALLVEDDASIADFVVRGLKEAGFAVDHAPDGDEGLKAAVDQSYDVAIVDLMLPRRDGLSLIEELR